MSLSALLASSRVRTIGAMTAAGSPGANEEPSNGRSGAIDDGRASGGWAEPERAVDGRIVGGRIDGVPSGGGAIDGGIDGIIEAR